MERSHDGAPVSPSRSRCSTEEEEEEEEEARGGATRGQCLDRPSPLVSPSSSDVSGRPASGAAAERRPVSPAGRPKEEPAEASRASGDASDGEARPDLPERLLLHHRLGYSVVTLTAEQRQHYHPTRVQELVLFKERKYNAVNVLGRFAVLLVLLLSIAIVCHVFAVVSRGWVVVLYRGRYESVGLFGSCHGQLIHVCVDETSSYAVQSVVDPVTGDLACATSGEVLQSYIGALWSLGILQLLSEVVTVVLSARLVCRPTRTRTLLLLVGAAAVSTICSIVVCALFPGFTACIRRTCTIRQEGADRCRVSYAWPYKMYIASSVIDMAVVVVGLCMYSYVVNIRVQAHRTLRATRRHRPKASPERRIAPDHPPGLPSARTSARSMPRREATQEEEVPIPTVRPAHPPHALRPSMRAGAGTTTGGEEASLIAHPSATVGEDEWLSPRGCSSTLRSPMVYLDDKKRRGLLSQHRREASDLLTAVELGVVIPGADDWVYDDRSDMYYSAALHMFWDLLTEEYYNCALKVWQVDPLVPDVELRALGSSNLFDERRPRRRRQP